MRFYLSLLLPILCLPTFVVCLYAKEKKVATASTALYTTIAQQDSMLFAAYNARNLELLKTFFTSDLEWYQDNGGLLDYTTVFKNFQDIFNRDYVLTRTLIKKSLHVSPIKGFGAIETGSHQFRHIENGKEEVGTFKFLMIWKQDGNTWKISRVVSYDH